MITQLTITDRINYILNTYALYYSTEGIKVLFMNKERFEISPELKNMLIFLEYDIKIYLKNNEILFITDKNGKNININIENFNEFVLK